MNRQAFAFVVAVAAAPALAADLPGRGSGFEAGGAVVAPPPAVIMAPAYNCCPIPRRPYVDPSVPTNSPCDPTYVGSSYGLNYPSYDGSWPRPGYDSPYGPPPPVPCY
jgi:hypothetical protein